MTDNRMTRFTRWLLTIICRRLVVQGPDHKDNIIEYYRIMRDAASDEFREDNEPTLYSFLSECFAAVVARPMPFERATYRAGIDVQPDPLVQKIRELRKSDKYRGLPEMDLFASMADKIENQQGMIRSACMDWSETHTHVQKVAKRYLPEAVVEGDSHGVPTIETLVDMIAEQIPKPATRGPDRVKRHMDLRLPSLTRIEEFCREAKEHDVTWYEFKDRLRGIVAQEDRTINILSESDKNSP
jgi:hypothetical protein